MVYITKFLGVCGLNMQFPGGVWSKYANSWGMGYKTKKLPWGKWEYFLEPHNDDDDDDDDDYHCVFLG